MTESAVYAAGAVVWRLVEGKVRVLLVHRTQYNDVTLPKGKVDPGEMLAQTAVREIEEETGIRVKLGVPVGVSRYFFKPKRQKIVHYWAAEASEEAIRVSNFVPNKEIAALEWLSVKKARAALTYPVDQEILDEFAALKADGALRSIPIIVLRHARATSREDWTGPDATRPLTGRGQRQAKGIVEVLRAFGVERIFSSDALRCVDTVKPLAHSTGVKIRENRRLSQDAWDDGSADIRPLISKRVRDLRPVVLCSHRPLLGTVIEEIALATGTLRGSYIADAASLPPGAFSVVHISATHPGSGIIAIETHESKF